jgi:mitogen-activated protein kinase 1/3
MHTTTLDGEIFSMPNNYQVERIIGKGTYGIVAAVTDKITNMQFAVKKTKINHDKVHLSKRVLRELRILAHLNHDNITKLYDVVVPKTYSRFTHIYAVTDLMQTDLRNIISSKQRLTPGHIQYIIFQLCLALNYVHSANILHRDIKPEVRQCSSIG